MTRERTIEQLKLMLRCPEDNLDDEDREAVEVCIEALEQEPNKWMSAEVLDKIRAEIQGLRNCSCSCSDGIIDDVEDIIDKYKAESEDKE